jgi:streptomycin 6-kinase
VAARLGGILTRSAGAARALLAEPRDVVPLHGDIHHGNVLDFGERGWLAIDPKRLEGERGFDYANLFCNPDHAIALAPGRLARQADIVARAAGLERQRLLQWILAWAGLSATWLIEDGEDELVAPTLRIAELAEAELGPDRR